MKAEILIVGTEILKGTVQDANSPFLTRELAHLGFELRQITCVGDKEADLLRALGQAWRSSTLILVTGGLGPTFDDLTRSCIARFFGTPLAFQKKVYEKIVKYFESRKRRANAIARWQSTIPAKAKIVENNFGVAPGFVIEEPGKMLVALPGVPREMEGMFRQKVRPLIQKRFAVSGFRKLFVFKTVGLQETQVLKRLGKGFPPQNQGIECGIYPGVGEVSLTLSLRDNDPRRLQRKSAYWRRRIFRRLRPFIYTTQDQTLEDVLGAVLRKHKKTISFAESLTGGLASKRLTDVPGASQYFRGAIVAYSKFAKKTLLQINRKVLQRHPPVSRQVAKAMAKRARELFHSDIGLSLTGVAGPSKDASGYPVGTVFIGLSVRRGTRTKRFHFFGGREKVRLAASQSALCMLRDYLSSQ